MLLNNCYRDSDVRKIEIIECSLETGNQHLSLDLVIHRRLLTTQTLLLSIVT